MAHQSSGDCASLGHANLFNQPDRRRLELIRELYRLDIAVI